MLLLLAQLRVDSLPPPRGFVNDFAGVIDTAAAARMDRLLIAVRGQTRGEIAVVTLADLGGREAGDVALQIGRQWGVGAKGEAGDPAKNLGVVVLLVPRKDHKPGTGAVFIASGRGAEGFLPDARIGRIRDAMIPYLAREDYGGGLEVAVGLLAQAFAEEFQVAIDGTPAVPVEPAATPFTRSVAGAIPLVVAFVVFLIFLSAVSARRRRGRRRIGWWGGGWSGGWGGGHGWGGRGGGGFGGGFGGFGGGGGFSGGGAGGKF